MENEIQPSNSARHKLPALIAPSDSMSYLGPFNFRQLLKPVQGRQSPHRKRRNIITVRNGAI